MAREMPLTWDGSLTRRLTSQTFSRGHSTDFWILAVLVSGIGSVGTAINIVATILCLRCPGMTLGKMPLFAWLNLVMAGLVLIAVSPLTAAQIMLLSIATWADISSIRRPAAPPCSGCTSSGSSAIRKSTFWSFLPLPSFPKSSRYFPAKRSSAIRSWWRRRMAIGFVSVSVWAHHMFTVGLSSNANTFFVLSTMAIAVPTGIKIFNWLATMWGGKIHFKTPMLFCIGFLFQFLIAGLTGVMLSSAPFDWQLGNSYFVVAHFHYVIVGGILFALFGAFYYWFPKMSGKMYSETLGKLHFVLFIIGFHLTFDSMHIPGLWACPDRIYTYEPGRGWDIWNLLATIGVVFQAAGVLVFVGNLLWSYFKGKSAGSDPWDAWTLEWSTSFAASRL